MGRAFSTLRNRTRGERDERRVLAWANRLYRLEVMVYELTTLMVASASDEPDEKTAAFLGEAEVFRSHLQKVLSALSPSDLEEVSDGS